MTDNQRQPRYGPKRLAAMGFGLGCGGIVLLFAFIMLGVSYFGSIPTDGPVNTIALRIATHMRWLGLGLDQRLDADGAPLHQRFDHVGHGFVHSGARCSRD